MRVRASICQYFSKWTGQPQLPLFKGERKHRGKERKKGKERKRKGKPEHRELKLFSLLKDENLNGPISSVKGGAFLSLVPEQCVDRKNA